MKKPYKWYICKCVTVTVAGRREVWLCPRCHTALYKVLETLPLAVAVDDAPA